MDEKKNNKVLIVLVIILTILILGLGGFIIYDKVLNKHYQNNTNKITNTNNNNKNESNKIDILSVCEENIDKIYSNIESLQNKSFIAKYYPNDLKKISKDLINCNEVEKYSDSSIIIRILYENFYSESFTFNFKSNEVKWFNEEDDSEESVIEHNSLEAFNYAKELISEDKDIFNKKHPELNIGTFKDKNYDNGDIYILSICEYEGEENYCLKHYYDYKINFNNKTFTKINIDME